MPALVAGIHDDAAVQRREDVDGRDKPGHDDGEAVLWRHCEDREAEPMRTDTGHPPKCPLVSRMSPPPQSGGMSPLAT